MSGLRIVFGGAFARVPDQGGLAWLVLQWVLGLRRLGHQVLLLEPIASDDLRPAGAPLAASDNAAWFRHVGRYFGIGEQAALCLDGGETTDLPAEQVRKWAAQADLLVDIAGGLAGAEWVSRIPVRLYLDVDPGFTQLWHAHEGIDMRLDRYTHFATVGLNFAPRNGVPDCGRRWLPTAQPVLLDEWPLTAQVTRPALTTVANWRGYGSIEVDGELFGQKAHSLRRFIDLPRECDVRCQLALAIDPGETRDVAALAANGWEVLDPLAVAGSPEDYRAFVQGSWAELGIAKSGYVKAQGGWFSDRSACYLASGRPVIAQDTGFAGALPVGAGLLAFSTMDDVRAAVEELRRDYGAHRRAAREIAEQHFGSAAVLGKLLDRLGSCGMSSRPATDAAVEAALRSFCGDAHLAGRRTLPYRSSYPLELLTVRLGGADREIVFKSFGGPPSAGSTWDVKPAFVRDPRREIEVYRDILTPSGCSAPAYLGSVIDSRRRRYWLFLEHLHGDLLWQRGDIESWLAAAHWLAAMHAGWGPDYSDLLPRLLRHDRSYYQRWFRRARRFSNAAEVAALEARFRRALDWLSDQPGTLLHGEFYPSNVIVDWTSPTAKVRPLDWETAGAGPGAIDLAALVSGWEEADRVAMAHAYRDALPTAQKPSLQELLDGLDHCRLLLAVQWLGWSARWAPPPQHATDWLATAMEIGGAS